MIYAIVLVDRRNIVFKFNLKRLGLLFQLHFMLVKLLSFLYWRNLAQIYLCIILHFWWELSILPRQTKYHVCLVRLVPTSLGYFILKWSQVFENVPAITLIALLRECNVLEHSCECVFNTFCSDNNFLDILFRLEISISLNHKIYSFQKSMNSGLL